MKQTKQRFIFLALAVLLALFAGCKGESPTAPPPITGTSGGGTGSGTTQPPVGASIALVASSSSPFTGSTSTITATVTLNNAPVPNGTAVEFATTTANANFTDTSDNPTTLIRTTTSGVAKATVTSSTADPVIVTVTVNNVTKSITLTFQDVVIPPTPTSTAPTISSVSPSSGLPTGNQQIVITGSNFRTPVRVLFNPGSGGAAKEAFVTSATPTQITVISPAFDLGVSQQLVVSVTVIVEAGLPTELRVTKATAFTYTAAVLTPVVRAVSPTSGPIDGGTRITITGDAFEAPLQVFFGSAQAQVLSVSFHQIDVMSPTARDTNANGSGAVTGPVDIRVLNVNSGKSVTATAAFRYVNKAQITAITPNQGPFTGGTRFTIDGTGFTAPVTVTLNGIAASIIKVSASEIIGISGAIAVVGCADSTGPTVMVNVDNGDGATGPNWIYRVLKPVITGVTTTAVTLGGNATVTVANAVGFPRITIGGIGASITNQTDNGNGTTTFTIVVPSTLPLTTQACSGAAGTTAQQPTAFDVTYTSLATTCTDTLVKGLTVNPTSGPILTLSPNGFTPFTAVITPAVIAPPTPASVKPSASQIVTIVNTGFGLTPLNVAVISFSGAGCAQFSIVPLIPPSPQVSLNQCETQPIVVQYNGKIPAGSDQCAITLTTSAGNRTLNLIGTSQ